MSLSARSSEGPVALTPKQANIFVWGWQPKARFRYAVCGRRFGKTFLGKAEMRRAARLAEKWQVSVEDEIWYAAPTFKQAKRVFWRRLKQAIPPSWRAGRPNESECSITLKSGHIMRIVGLDAYDNLRGSGLFFVLIDEWADCPYEAWEEVLRPMLSTCTYIVDGEVRKGGHALRIGTPKGFNHCFDSYRDGQDGREPDHKSWLYTSLQGGNVPSEEIEAARRKMDPRTFRQEYEASFENYQGVIYLNNGRGSGGFGPNPISSSELQAWSQLEGVRLTWWELKALRGMDAAYMAVATKQDDADAPEPKEWDDLPEPERKAQVAVHIKNVLRG